MNTTLSLTERPIRDPWHRTGDGAWATVVDPDAVHLLSIDWTDSLASGETIASVTYSTGGPTTSGAALASPTSTVTVTGSGDLTVTATTSASRILIRTLRYLVAHGSDGYSESDYGE